jgi:protocatechuate 3,4-dioxygenase beta subunit
VTPQDWNRASTGEPIAAPPADDAAQPPTGQLSLAGRLLDLAGRPVSGIDLEARRYDARRGPVAAGERRSRSDPAGRYEFDGLTPGDYEVRTVETRVYPSTWKIFRAGLGSADIVLAARSSVQVYGIVTDTGGAPLAGVEVAPGAPDAVTVWTDEAGSYRTQLSVADPARSFTLRFRLPDYVDEQVHLEGRQLAAAGESRVDVQLRRLTATTTVTGRLRDEQGTAVPSEVVQLQSASLGTHYMARSDADGAFSMQAVEPAPDYRLTIHPQGAYRNHWQQGVVIDGPETSLMITLQPLETGRLTGRMVDVAGNPLPGFSLQLQSSNSQGRLLTVIADEGGYFVVENAPAGNLLFATQSEPRFVVSGLVLEAGTTGNAEVVLDWGTHELTGRVRDELGNPLPGAELKLSWTHAARGIHSTALRRTIADGNGFFRFTQLAAAPHQLEAAAPGYLGVKQDHAIGRSAGEIEVELRRVPP